MREAGEHSIAKGEGRGGDKEGGGSMCHGVGQDGCMMNLTKASNVLCALRVLHGVCLRMGWVRAIFMRQQGAPSQMVRFISPNPNPITISP